MRDVAGRCRVNMFEKIRSRDGRVFTPVSKVGDDVTYAVSDGSRITTHDRRLSGEELVMQQQMQQLYPSLGED